MKLAIFEVNLYWSLYTKMEIRPLIRSFSLVRYGNMIVHVEKRNILGYRNTDDGSCHRTSDTINPQNGRKSEGILRKSVMWEAI